MKVAICTPCYASLHPQFVLSLLGVIARSYATGVHAGFLTISTSSLPASRTELARLARKQGADYILWADADQKFPPDALERLLAHRLDVIGTNIPQRYEPFQPTAKRDGAVIWTTQESVRARKVEEVTEFGLGLCLVRASVFDRLPDPPFLIDNTPEHGWQGEDYHFCRKLREAGFKLYIDHALSWEVGHIGETVITHAKALEGRGGAVESTILSPAGNQ